VHPHYSSLLSRRSLERDFPQNIGKLHLVKRMHGYPGRVCRHKFEKALAEFRERATGPIAGRKPSVTKCINQ